MGIKLTTNTANVIEAENSLVTLRCVGLLFMGVGLLACTFLWTTTTLNCVRDQSQPAQCTLEKVAIWGTTTTSISGDSIRELYIESTRSSSSDSRTYRIALDTDQGTIPFTTAYSSGRSGKERKANMINNFLKDSQQQQASIEQDSRIVGLLFGVIFSGVGLAVILLFDKSRLRMSIPENRFQLSKKNAFGEKITDYSLDDVKDVQLEMSRSSKGSNTYRVSFLMTNGTVIPLTSHYSSGVTSKQNTVNAIKRFLENRPLPAIDDNSNQKGFSFEPLASSSEHVHAEPDATSVTEAGTDSEENTNLW